MKVLKVFTPDFGDLVFGFHDGRSVVTLKFSVAPTILLTQPTLMERVLRKIEELALAFGADPIEVDAAGPGAALIREMDGWSIPIRAKGWEKSRSTPAA